MYNRIEWNTIFVVFFLIALSVLPSLMYVSLSLDSLAVGFFISIFFFMIYLSFRVKCISLNDLFFSFFFFVFFILYSFDILNNPGKNIASSLIIFFTLLTASLFSTLSYKKGGQFLQNIFLYTTILLLFIGIVGITFKFNYLGFFAYPKSILFFYEPSNYAIVAGPFYIVTMLLAKKYKYIYCALFLLISLLSQNLTMIIYWFFGVWFSSKRKMKFSFMTILSITIIIIILYFNNHAMYYMQRLDIRSTSNNLSVLVFLQGWSEMLKSIFDSYGVGLGFQDAGTNTPSHIAIKIFKIAKIYKNRQDAGFLAAKIIIEFGIIGAIFVFYVLYRIVSSMININDETCIHKRVISGIFISLFIELFFRGQGYFTMGMFLLCFAFFLSKKINKRNVDA
ncbi:hypothetical protein [Yersinia ruckeri]|uniref:hypothetical protein n=1 Tax=Yersinia ruckeri TaxID=29486 RepID=UPI0005EAA1BA|nr:hypothetical protein [Yersinia ruckeri]AKA39329.1 hypothetical protein UGYR_13615 [Yersinia ruckeri]EKN4691352.1 hypothetical protein [Yersinia ruckeri]ELM3740750.1 hypothetical protein [Yersinia ruckeri]MCK8541585.1 hypothetical protein [Yersinia ruckeri]MCK8551490.1 hypothetical protein [Yersinia ruckeri]